jgi:hypothetical protein
MSTSIELRRMAPLKGYTVDIKEVFSASKLFNVITQQTGLSVLARFLPLRSAV